jgi:hypothetical protein
MVIQNIFLNCLWKFNFGIQSEAFLAAEVKEISRVTWLKWPTFQGPPLPKSSVSVVALDLNRLICTPTRRSWFKLSAGQLGLMDGGLGLLVLVSSRDWCISVLLSHVSHRVPRSTETETPLSVKVFGEKHELHFANSFNLKVTPIVKKLPGFMEPTTGSRLQQTETVHTRILHFSEIQFNIRSTIGDSFDI